MEKVEEALIPYDQMKEQVLRELTGFMDSLNSPEDPVMPYISYERGSTQISFHTPPLTDSMLFDCLSIKKST
jgi:hypothetical protein